MTITTGWSIVVRLAQDPNTLFRGVVRGFLSPHGASLEQLDVMTAQVGTQVLAKVEAHSDDIRHICIGGSLDDGYDEVYPLGAPTPATGAGNQ